MAFYVWRELEMAMGFWDMPFFLKFGRCLSIVCDGQWLGTCTRIAVQREWGVEG